MSRALAPTLAVALMGLLAALGGCGDDFRELDAAAPFDAGVPDEGAGVDGGIPVGAVFTVVGCDELTFDAGAHALCIAPRGRALSFVPLAAGVDTVMWTFPSGTPASSTLLTPEVRWASAGTYRVTLTAGGGGGSAIGTGQVRIALGGVGATCDSDGDCDAGGGYACLCGDGAACPAALSAGVCVHRCESGGCAVGEVCIDLTRGGAGNADAGVSDGGNGDAYRAKLCLPTCSGDATCRAGMVCRELPTGGSGASARGWARACFAPVLGEVGAPCLTVDGIPDGSRCLTGRCELLGARGVCSEVCDQSTPCPSYAACATLPALGARCLARCTGATCGDPLVSCQGPGAGGLGYTLPVGEPADTKLCAALRCANTSECAPAGTCSSVGGGLFCVR